MRRFPRVLSFALLAAVCASTAARAEIGEPRLVRVLLSPELPVTALLEAGLDVVSVRGSSEAKILEWPGDEATLARLGAHREVLDEHPGRTAARRTAAEFAARPPAKPRRVSSATGPDGAFRTQLLPPFGSGSMGGYWTSDEIKMKLDDLVASDANDVVADKLDTLGWSIQGRPIWGLKLGKRVTGPDSRPVAFFSALTHAREPQGMQALLYFVDHLLAGYGSDPFATYLLDHRVIYLTPLVNPDGYKTNENTYFGSGGTSFGYWRKNLRDNNGNSLVDGQDGVDINRNYGHRWAYDNIGSSGSWSAENYRGTAAFSEPETRAQRDIVTALEPVTGLSFHTHGDLFIHPWGYIATPTLDDAAFAEWSDELSRENAYLTGQGPVILYPVNGEFNDWCYGDTLAKPRMFSWTPEVGDDSDGFWPLPSRIVPLAAENLRACYVTAALAGPWVQEDGVGILEGALNAGHAANLTVHARNLGASGSAGPGLSGTLTALDAGARVLFGTVGYPTLSPRQSGPPGLPFQVAVDDTVTPGRLLRFEIAFSAPDGFYSRDTVAIPAGTPTLVLADHASAGLGLWSPGSWGIVAGDPDHPSRYFSDSPAGDYPPSVDNRMTLNPALDLSAGVHAYAFYEARWELEQDYDAASIEASLDGANWTRLNATGTTPGSGINFLQPLGLPVYAGNRRLWKPERADLSAFTGPAAAAVRLRFRLRSDSRVSYDGFSFDSLRVMVYDPAVQPAPVAVSDLIPLAIELSPPAPNPARSLARFAFALPRGGTARLEIFDVQGRRVRTLVAGILPAGRHGRDWDLGDDGGRRVPAGVYLARLSGAAGQVTRRLAVVD